MIPQAAVSGRWGAYGLHLGNCASSRWLIAAPEDWRTVTVAEDARLTTMTPPELSGRDVSVVLEGDLVRIATVTGWRLVLDLPARTATYRGVGLASPELIHPGLAATAAIFSRSWGRSAWHAGGVVIGGRAWAVVGAREAGKTTLLAAMARAGHAVVADDLLILDGAQVYAGPRCLDLREVIPGMPTTRVRDGVRHRVTLGPVPERVPFAGWVVLAWGDRPGLAPISAGQRLRHLAPAASWSIGPEDPLALLEAATAPCFLLTRPRQLSGIVESTALLQRLG